MLCGLEEEVEWEVGGWVVGWKWKLGKVGNLKKESRQRKKGGRTYPPGVVLSWGPPFVVYIARFENFGVFKFCFGDFFKKESNKERRGGRTFPPGGSLVATPIFVVYIAASVENPHFERPNPALLPPPLAR